MVSTNSRYFERRLAQSLRLFDSLDCFFSHSKDIDSIDVDKMYLHIMECIGALSCLQSIIEIQDNLKLTKRKIFWQAVQEVAKSEEVVNEPIHELMQSFPDESKLVNNRMWLPFHFAVLLPRVELSDIQSLFTAQPDCIKMCTDDHRQINPCHLAAMVETPCLPIIRRLKIFYPRFGSIVTSDGCTPLHLAALHSSSVEMIMELIQVCPTALRMTNNNGETPLCLVSENITPQAPGILHALLIAAPDTVTMVNNHSYQELPIHRFLRFGENRSAQETLPILLDAHKESINIPDLRQLLPLHIAARHGSVEVLKIIVESNSTNLSTIIPGFGSIAHQAVIGNKIANLRYICSVNRSLMLVTDLFNRTPLHHAVGLCESELIKAVYALAPEAVRQVDVMNFNLLHLLVKRKRNGPLLEMPLSDASESLRFLLRHFPEGLMERNNDGLTPFEMLPDVNVYARRLLLITGAPSLFPDTRKELNYQARRVALYAFFSPVVEPTIFTRIRWAPAGPSLMQHVVSYL